MKTYRFEMTADTTAERLYRAITDVTHWPDWDEGLEKVTLARELSEGVNFTLKPKGGPATRITVESAKPSVQFIDVAHLPLAKMRTSHLFKTEGGKTHVAIVIEVWGLLGFLWDRLVARGQADGAEKQTKALIAYANRMYA